jgi:hypothetical protein
VDGAVCADLAEDEPAILDPAAPRGFPVDEITAVRPTIDPTTGVG